jgi:hypothetical protein
MPTSTKYELATELRALTRGMKALPICKMTKAQLETEIDRIKVLKQLKEDIPDYEPAKRGPVGPRTVTVKQVIKDGIEIVVPEAPPKRVTRKADAIRVSGPTVVNFEEPKTTTPPPTLEIKEVTVDPPVSTAIKPHRCNCAHCPKKA